MCKCKRFLCFFFLFLLVPLPAYIWQKRNMALLTDVLKEKKKNILHYCVHTEENDRQIKEWNRAMETVILNKF